MKANNYVDLVLTKRRPNYVYAATTLLSTLFAFIGSQALAVTIILVIGMSFGYNGKTVANAIDKNIVVQFLTYLSVELLIIWFVRLFLRIKKQSFSNIGLKRKPIAKDAFEALRAYAVYFAIFFVISNIIALFNIIDTTQAQQLGFNHIRGFDYVFAFVSLVVLPPLAEEILFRGYLFHGLKKRMHWIIAGLITSLLFGAAHLEFTSGNSLNWAAALDTFILSSALVYVTHRTKSLWPAILLHALKNSMAFLFLFVIK